MLDASAIVPYTVDNLLHFGVNETVNLSPSGTNHVGGVNLKAHGIFPAAKTNDILYVYKDHSSTLNRHVMAYYKGGQVLSKNYNITLTAWSPSEGSCYLLEVNQPGLTAFLRSKLCLASASAHYVYSVYQYYNPKVDMKAPNNILAGKTVDSVFYPKLFQLSAYNNHTGGVYLYGQKLFPSLSSSYICYLYYNTTSNKHTMLLYSGTKVVKTFDATISAWIPPTPSPSSAPSLTPTTAPVTNPSPSPSNTLSTGAIVGISVGVVIGCILIFLILYFGIKNVDDHRDREAAVERESDWGWLSIVSRSARNSSRGSRGRLSAHSDLSSHSAQPLITQM